MNSINLKHNWNKLLELSIEVIHSTSRSLCLLCYYGYWWWNSSYTSFQSCPEDLSDLWNKQIRFENNV